MQLREGSCRAGGSDRIVRAPLHARQDQHTHTQSRLVQGEKGKKKKIRKEIWKPLFIFPVPISLFTPHGDLALWSRVVCALALHFFACLSVFFLF